MSEAANPRSARSDVRSRPFESQLGEPCFQCRRLQAELFGRTTDAANAPASALEHPPDVRSLDVHQLDTPARRRRRRLRNGNGEPWTGRRDNRALDDVAKLADIAGPRIA